MNVNLVIDVHYENNSAIVAGILFEDWTTNEISRTILTTLNHVEPYEPGAFYKRELPCILELLKEVTEELNCIIIDGYVVLGEDQVDGLGMHLYHSMNQEIPIIGVAKKPFLGTPKDYEVFRGESKNPLLISSVGLSLEKSKTLVKSMHGKHRIPTLLKQVDQLCRGIE